MLRNFSNLPEACKCSLNFDQNHQQIAKMLLKFEFGAVDLEETSYNMLVCLQDRFRNFRQRSVQNLATGLELAVSPISRLIAGGRLLLAGAPVSP